MSTFNKRTIGRPRTERPGLRTWIGVTLLLLPTVLLAALLVATGNPGAESAKVTAAVVNEDEPVTIDGQLMPLGRQLTAELLHPKDEDANIDWVLTNPDDAAEGLENGDYGTVVTIGREFSADATSVAETDPATARKATIDVATAPDSPVADAAVTETLLDAGRASLSGTVTESFLDNIFLSFNDMHDQLGQAADGSAALADGTNQLRDGTRQAKTGTGQLAEGLPLLAGGAGELAGGARALDSGAGELGSGLTTLHDGAGTLSHGLGELSRQTAELPGQTRALADGSAQVADGTQQLADLATPLSETAGRQLEAIGDFSPAAAELKEVAESCTGAAVCGQLQELAERISGEAANADEQKRKAGESISTLAGDINRLNDGAHQVADGNARLADASTALVGGITAARDGSNELTAGLGTAKDGATQLSAGAGQLSGGAVELSDRSREAADGARQLDDGMVALTDGSSSASDGARELADGLGQARGQVPTFSDEGRKALATTAADPILTAGSGKGYTLPLAVLLAALILWCAATATSAYLRPIPADAMMSGESTGRLLLRNLPLRAVNAVIHAVVVTIALVVATGAEVVSVPAVFGCALVAMAVFTTIAHVLRALWPRAGIIVMLGGAVIAGVAGATSAGPGFVHSIGDLLPLRPAADALRLAVDGSAGGAAQAALPLLVWLVAAVLALWVVTESSRSTSAEKFLRAPV